MIRKAILKDVNSIEDTYNEHFQYELNHTAFTVFKKGVYPTKDDAERPLCQMDRLQKFSPIL